MRQAALETGPGLPLILVVLIAWTYFYSSTECLLVDVYVIHHLFKDLV
jgi:hypothetical protein